MNSYFGVIIVILYMLVSFAGLGIILRTWLKLDTDKHQTFLLGAVAYFMLFFIEYVPIQYTSQSLKTLCIWWIITSVGIIAAFVCTGIIKRKLWKEEIIYRFKRIDASKWVWLGVSVIFMAYAIGYTMNITYYSSLYDNSFYNGNINSILYSGKMTGYDGYTGVEAALTAFQKLRLYEIYVCTVSKIFGIHPLIVVNRVMGIAEITASVYFAYLTAKTIFNGYKKAVIASVLFFYINTYMINIYTSANFLFYRLGETKSITANVSLPFMLLLICWLYSQWENKAVWAMLFGLSVLAPAVNDSAIFLAPVSLGVLIVPFAIRFVIKKRKLKLLLWSFICFFPYVLYIMLYMHS